MLNSIVYSSHARHVSIRLIVLASYDEYTALVKSGNVASKHLVETWIRDLLSYVTLLLVVWWLVLCCLSFRTRELV